jgi:hypothetical protein
LGLIYKVDGEEIKRMKIMVVVEIPEDMLMEEEDGLRGYDRLLVSMNEAVDKFTGCEILGVDY